MALNHLLKAHILKFMATGIEFDFTARGFEVELRAILIQVWRSHHVAHCPRRSHVR